MEHYYYFPKDKISSVAKQVGILGLIISSFYYIKKYEPIDGLTLWLNENKGICRKENIMQCD